MIIVTPAAAEQIRAAAVVSEAEGLALRLAARRDADGSLHYAMGFDRACDPDLRIVSEGINRIFSPEKAFVLITHYQRILDYVKPKFVHVLSEGRIVQSGGPELPMELEKKGYGWIEEKVSA